MEISKLFDGTGEGVHAEDLEECEGLLIKTNDKKFYIVETESGLQIHVDPDLTLLSKRMSFQVIEIE